MSLSGPSHITVPLTRTGSAAGAGECVPTGIRLAGMHKLTTLDYPGKLSAIVFTQGCNFHCPYCHNAHLIPCDNRALQLATDEALAFLHKRTDVLDGLVVSGGEPTLHGGLAGFCREVKALGYSIKLDTNGSRPEVLQALLEESLVDYVAVDCKSAPAAYFPDFTAQKNAGEQLERTAVLLRASGVTHEFRTTCVAPYVRGEHLEAMLALVKDSPWFLQRARLDVSMREKGMYPLSAEEIDAFAAQCGGYGLHPVVR